MTVHLHYKGGANSRIKKQNVISISKAPGALFRENTVLCRQKCKVRKLKHSFHVKHSGSPGKQTKTYYVKYTLKITLMENFALKKKDSKMSFPFELIRQKCRSSTGGQKVSALVPAKGIVMLLDAKRDCKGG